jgi:hypothetical protein
MRKIIKVIIVMSAMFAFLSCSTTNRNMTIPANFPGPVKKALRNVPNDVLIGIGVAKFPMLNMSLNVSAARARAELSRQLNSIVHEIVLVNNDAEASFKETVIVTISQSTIVGSKIIVQHQARDGSMWTVVSLDKANVVNEIDQANSLARRTTSSTIPFNATDRIDAAFANAVAQKYQVNDR